MESANKYYLEFCASPVRFEAVNQLTNVFFDDSNKQVFAVRSEGAMGVVVKGPSGDNDIIHFRMEGRGPVISIKFSLDQTVVAVQRTTSSLEFMNYNGNTVEGEYSQNCRKNANLLGFVWLPNNEIALITDHGVELYVVIVDKKSLKHLKSSSFTVQWFIWDSANKIALLASAQGSNLQPILFKPGAITKLHKLETEPGRMTPERDVTLATLYNVPAVLILRHQSGPQAAEVHIYTFSGPGQSPVKTHVLHLNLSGRFAINVVDDLIIVHHQASRSSQVFDTGVPGENDGSVEHHTAIAPARSLKPAVIPLPGLVEPQNHNCELYSPNWVVFQPNIVIDAKLGCLWHIQLCLEELCTQIADLGVCTQVALKRTSGKEILLKLILDNIQLPKPPLEKLLESFNYINAVYREWMEAQLQMQIGSPAGAPIPAKPSTPPRVLISQIDVYQQVLQQLADNEQQLTNLEWSLVSYITSLCEYDIPTDHTLNEMLITTLVRRNKFTTLMQYLQYGVISDSKPLACLLLSLGNLHSGASQLALDMLARLNAKDELQEVLLDQGDIMAALKLAPENVNPRKFLQAAQSKNDPALFHSVLYFFQSNPRYADMFAKDERLNAFVEHYKMLFPEETKVVIHS